MGGLRPAPHGDRSLSLSVFSTSASNDDRPPVALVFDPAVEGFDVAFARFAALYAAGADVRPVGRDFFAEVRARLLPGMVIFSRTLRGVEMRRDRARTVRDGMDHFTIQLVRSGVLRLDLDGEERTLGPGAGVLVDLTQPARSLPHGSLFTASVSRERLREAGLDPAGLHGAPLAAGDRRLAALMAGDHLAGGAQVGAILEEVRAQLRPEAWSADEAAVRRETARRIIEATLADPELSPVRIASAAGMSRATLYRAFEPLGGVTEWVQARRLQRVRTLLALTPMSVSEAGRRAGFVSPSHLSRTFQARFGRPPSALRRRFSPADLRNGAPVAIAALAAMGAALSPEAAERAAA